MITTLIIIIIGVDDDDALDMFPGYHDDFMIIALFIIIYVYSLDDKS